MKRHYSVKLKYYSSVALALAVLGPEAARATPVAPPPAPAPFLQLYIEAAPSNETNFTFYDGTASDDPQTWARVGDTVPFRMWTVEKLEEAKEVVASTVDTVITYVTGDKDDKDHDWGDKDDDKDHDWNDKDDDKDYGWGGGNHEHDTDSDRVYDNRYDLDAEAKAAAAKEAAKEAKDAKSAKYAAEEIADDKDDYADDLADDAEDAQDKADKSAKAAKAAQDKADKSAKAAKTAKGKAAKTAKEQADKDAKAAKDKADQAEKDAKAAKEAKDKADKAEEDAKVAKAKADQAAKDAKTAQDKADKASKDALIAADIAARYRDAYNDKDHDWDNDHDWGHDKDYSDKDHDDKDHDDKDHDDKDHDDKDHDDKDHDDDDDDKDTPRIASKTVTTTTVTTETSYAWNDLKLVASFDSDLNPLLQFTTVDAMTIGGYNLTEPSFAPTGPNRIGGDLTANPLDIDPWDVPYIADGEFSHDGLYAAGRSWVEWNLLAPGETIENANTAIGDFKPGTGSIFDPLFFGSSNFPNYSGDEGQIRAYDLLPSGLMPGDKVHFDLWGTYDTSIAVCTKTTKVVTSYSYTKTKVDDKWVYTPHETVETVTEEDCEIENTLNQRFAPFDHDARWEQADAAPAPAALSIFGLGLFGLGALRRRIRNKNVNEAV